MNTTTVIVIVGVIVLGAIAVAILAAAGRTRGFRGPKLKPLSSEARERYGAQWDRVEARFVDDPEGAAREADSILMGMLREREHPMTEDQLPARMKKARRLASGQEGKGGTEGLRQAVLEYRSLMEEHGRSAEGGDRTRGDHREIAS